MEKVTLLVVRHFESVYIRVEGNIIELCYGTTICIMVYDILWSIHKNNYGLHL